MQSSYLRASVGEQHFGPLTSTNKCSSSYDVADHVLRRHLIEQYRTCKNAEEVSAKQEEILKSLEADYEASRRERGVYAPQWSCVVLLTVTDEHAEEDDWLEANPNHRAMPPPESDSEDDVSSDNS